ncbi:MAG TPA: hypothetical protein ENG99_00250 [bacterium]|nr:hypothetical protein [bacterium]
MRYARNINNIHQGAFSLVELLVTMSIALTITLMLFANYPRFRATLSLKRDAQEVALSVRQAQVYGTSVRKYGGGVGVFPGYGIHFDSSIPDSYILFADVNANNSYDGVSEAVETLHIGSNDKISNLCGNAKTSPPGACGLSSLDVIFLRPNPTVILVGEGSNFSDAEVEIKSSSGDQKTVVIWSTGQITVE